MGPRTIALCAACLSAALWLATTDEVWTVAAGDAQPASGAEPAHAVEVARVLRAQREAGHVVDAGLRDELVALAAVDPAPVVAVLLERAIPPVEPEQGPQALNRYQERLALEALATAPLGRIEPCLPEALADPSGLAGQLRIMGVCLPAGRALELLEAWERSGAPRAALDALRDGLISLLEREPQGFSALEASDLTSLSSRARVELTTALGELGSARGLPLLLDMLRDPQVPNDHVLAQLARGEAVLELELAIGCADSVATWLSSPTPRERELASRALSRLAVPIAEERLIELLTDEVPSVREAAHAALCCFSGLRLPPDPMLWSEWYERITGEDAKRLETALSDVESLSLAKLSGRLRELTGLAYYRHRIGEALLPLLERPEAEVRALVCGVLAELRSPGVVPELVTMLSDADESVSEAARSALISITGGSPEPADPFESEADAWGRWLERRSVYP